MKKGLLLSGIVFFLFSLFSFSLYADEGSSLNIHLFYGDGCPHCAEEKDFLFNTFVKEYPQVDIYEYEIYYNRNNARLLQDVSKELGIRVDGVPFLVIGERGVVGYRDSTTPQQIRRYVDECLEQQCPDPLGSIVGISEEEEVSGEEEIINEEKEYVSVPVLGEIDPLHVSLPLLTVVMGALDGFNPCAMWALLFLISLLLGMRDRKRMWLLGTVFIIASAFVYFLFMAAWLHLILFIGVILWIRIGIGGLALFGGGYSIREFFKKDGAGCKVSEGEKKKKIFYRIKSVVHEHSLWLALGGIILLAFAVNLIELICSAGLPAVYTQVLALNQMALWQYYGYILLYIFFFMLDDLFVFVVAMVTLEITGITTRYVKWARLIGGVIMIIIGILLIFKPEWLLFS